MRQSIIILFVFLTSQVFSQDDGYDAYRKIFMFDLHLNGISNVIKDFDKTIIPEPFFTNYSLINKPVYRLGAGISINWKPSFFSVQADIDYSPQGSKLLFNNYQTDFNYQIFAKYDYINFSLIGKVYPLDHYEKLDQLNVGVGLQLGAVTNKENLLYKSWGSGYQPAFGTDMEQQRQLQNVIRARQNCNIIFSLGYEFSIYNKIPLTVDFCYMAGLNDAIEVYPNSYNFADNDNRYKIFQLKIGYVLTGKANGN